MGIKLASSLCHILSQSQGPEPSFEEWPHCAIDVQNPSPTHSPPPQSAITFPTSYFFSCLSFGAGRTDEMKTNKQTKKPNFLHWTRTLKSSFMALGVNQMLCMWTNICSVAQTKDCSLWKDWWLLPELEPLISEQVDWKRGWLQDSLALVCLKILPL